MSRGDGWHKYYNWEHSSTIKELYRRHEFSVRPVTDRRTGDKAELVIGYLHYWKFFVAEKRPAGPHGATAARDGVNHPGAR